MSKTRIILYLLLSFSLLSLSCKDSSKTSVPVVANVQNSYAYTLVATGYSENRTDTLSFNTDSLVVALTVSGYAGGSGEIQIMNSENTVFFSEVLDGNKVIAHKDIVRTVPGEVSIKLSDFSGRIVFALSEKGSSG